MGKHGYLYRVNPSDLPDTTTTDIDFFKVPHCEIVYWYKRYSLFRVIERLSIRKGSVHSGSSDYSVSLSLDDIAYLETQVEEGQTISDIPLNLNTIRTVEDATEQINHLKEADMEVLQTAKESLHNGFSVWFCCYW
jgi:hypothetical protein